jgi:hypothetical protein
VVESIAKARRGDGGADAKAAAPPAAIRLGLVERRIADGDDARGE